MIFGWLKRRRRRRYLRETAPGHWVPHLEELPFAQSLNEEELQRLVGLARAFVRETAFEGCAGFEIRPEVERSIALQACRLILNLGLDGYERVRTVLVYPRSFHVGDGFGDRTHAAGLAVPDGPVILAWDYAERGGRVHDDGRNLVYHEFAHKLDMLDGYPDGVPPLGNAEQYESWRTVIDKEFRALQRDTRRGRRTLIDDYGATNLVEFFAEATEVFFERPGRLRAKHEDLYWELAKFYRQDPARR